MRPTSIGSSSSSRATEGPGWRVNQLLGAALLATLVVSPAAALAEPAAASTTSAQADENGQLPTVTVTAAKRSESLQQVPVAVSVLEGEALEQANRNTLGSLTSQVPSLNFRTGASNKDTSLFLRGVGTISTSPGVEPTVSTVIDGVPLARPGQSTLDLLDVQRIEVLRGPQGTLFGKNASAGVINIVSREPASELERFIDASYYGFGNETRLRAGISGPIAPGLRASLTALAGHEDGNVTNVYDGSRVNGYDKRGVRGRLVWDIDRDSKLSLSADFLKSRDDIPTGVVTRTSLIAYPSGTVSTYPAFAAALGPVQASDDNRRINTNLATQVEDRNRGVALQYDRKLGGGHQLTAITGWRAWNNDQLQDGDRLSAAAVGLPQSHDHGQLDFEQLSQEVRIASPLGQNFGLPIDYVAGLLTFHTKDKEIYRRDVLRVVANGTDYSDWGEAHYGSNSHSTAVFGEGRWHFSPSWRAIAGARWTQDRLDFNHERERSTPDAQFNGAIPGVNPAVSINGDTSAIGRSGRLGLQNDLSESATAYLTYTRGYKGPAFNVFFNMLARDALALKPETSNSVELGLKSEWLDRRVRLNVAAFSTDYKNYQANFYDTVDGTVVTRLINAGEVSSRGLEIDLQAQATRQLSVSAALAYVHARIDQFNCPAGAAASCDVNGKPLPFSPDWKASVQASYRIPLAEGRQLELGTDYAWQSKVQYDIGQFADTIQGAYGIWNASIAVAQPTKGWRVALLAKNLLDKSYAPFLGRGSTFVNRWVPRDDQRYFGVQARYDF
ncbi:iron complex outermembrane recepter protein [Roseateles sp. YR242]|uniref:TonB-dependent receptor n=1 Tax=Roseateles sp. YR242 TaxID=1855305 RepID=UPI0008C87E7E|nr:TonB-dependent receptor [Roseateles sp. YR242]SEL85045.1 iron complex outermembrane recepter protein [Roseateles sp. YR242]